MEVHDKVTVEDVCVGLMIGVVVVSVTAFIFVRGWFRD